MTGADFPKRNKVMVIGIDGATFRIIDPLVQSGELPALGRLIEEGTRGILRSTLHPLSPPAWASLMTGMNPGKHGIFDFIARDPTSYEFRPVNGAYLGARTLWSRLGEAGKRVGVINVPMTYPPEPVNGFLISGMDSPRLDRAYSFPPSLSKEIDEVCGGYLVDCSTQGPKGLSREEMTSLYTQRLLQVTRKQGSVARYLWQKYHPDFLMVVFAAADRVQHAAGEAIERFKEGEPSRLSRCIGEIYQCIDTEIEQFLNRIDEAWTVIIVSDHGGTPYKRVFNLTYWLAENEFLHFSKGRALGALTYWSQRAERKIVHLLRSGSRKELSRTSPLLHIIDWQRTKAYAFGAFGSIFVNLQGREPCGSVEPGKEYEDLCAEISERLLEARDPLNGARLVQNVHRAQDIYSGGYLWRAPDLLITPSKDYFVRNSLDHYEWSLTYPAGRYGRRSIMHTGMHSLEGVFIAWGPVINKEAEIQDAQIVDVAPTILYLLGEPIPREMDGRRLEGAIHPQYLAQNPVLLRDAEEERPEGPRQKTYNEREEREIEERLRGLGYLG